MTKQDFVAKVAADSGLTHEQTKKALDAILGTIQTAVASGERIEFQGFGAFERAHRGERAGHNIKTGDRMLIAARNVPAFKAAKAFKDAVAAA